MCGMTQIKTTENQMSTMHAIFMPLLKKACKRLKNTQTIFRFVDKTTMNVFVALNVDMLIIKNVYFHVNKI